tara:strand:+ start:260 stop:370 length:111 start_codon:yes stop_codon:yes gene_type:complete
MIRVMAEKYSNKNKRKPWKEGVIINTTERQVWLKNV